ncbi:substrate-binding domain-containing protein [Demequina soli]|uniref:substrate-binding domain-containing protein n=1 Tax=Demequina soli TaxID=1638987 RepID=UPI0007838C61|nr:substrate-binding domain-containing protein [Demequina soli]
MKKSHALGLAAVAASAALISACSAPATSGSPAASSGGDGPFTIGVSNAFVASEYRTQMIDAIEQTFDEYKAEGVVDKLVMENADADVNGQIQQIRNLINQGVDAIIVDPNSATALSAVFDEAISQGITVIAIDQAVDSPDVLNVGISQQDLGAASAEWFASAVGDGASIVTVEGAAGNPATDARWAGAEPVFAEHNIEVLTHGDGGWDQATGQTVATDLLATYPNVDGIWTYDGMAQGVLRAVEAADKTDSVTVGGEARVGFLRMWTDLVDSGSDFASVGVINPPGTGATALHFAINLLQGKELDQSKVTDGHSIILPLDTPVTNDNLADTWAGVSDQADTYVLDSILSADEVAQYFQ